MTQRTLWVFGLALLLLGAAGSFGGGPMRFEGATPVDEVQASQVIGGQYCSWYTVGSACGGPAKHDPMTNAILTYCPVEANANYNAIYGVSGTPGLITNCTECGVYCGVYVPLLSCGS